MERIKDQGATEKVDTAKYFGDSKMNNVFVFVHVYISKSRSDKILGQQALVSNHLRVSPV